MSMQNARRIIKKYLDKYKAYYYKNKQKLNKVKFTNILNIDAVAAQGLFKSNAISASIGDVLFEDMYTYKLHVSF